jgi:hypothetical protein
MTREPAPGNAGEGKILPAFPVAETMRNNRRTDFAVKENARTFFLLSTINFEQ